MITKKDWENALKQYEAIVINTRVSLMAQEYMVKVAEEELAKFTDDDPAPEDVKEVIKEAIK